MLSMQRQINLVADLRKKAKKEKKLQTSITSKGKKLEQKSIPLKQPGWPAWHSRPKSFKEKAYVKQ